MSNVITFPGAEYARIIEAEAEEQRVWAEFFRDSLRTATMAVSIQRANAHLERFKLGRDEYARQLEIAARFMGEFQS